MLSMWVCMVLFVIGIERLKIENTLEELRILVKFALNCPD
jgi:hypothetical protein